jgi:peptide/nickel transport system substrate-binding protein
MKTTRLGAVVAGVAATLVLSACSGPADSKDDADGGGDGKGTINVFMYQKPTGIFSPIAPASGPDQQVLSLIYEPMMTADPEGTLQPQLAESAPEISEDATTVTFTLKEGLTWSDGEPITSADVVFSWTRAADSRTGSGFTANFSGIKGVSEYVAGSADTISGLAAPDDRTVTVTSLEPDVGVIGRIGILGIMPEHALKDLPTENFAKDAWFQDPAVTSGPYTFDEYKTDQYVHLEANPRFREPVGAAEIFLKPVTADVATQQLSTGEMDIATISPTDVEAVEGFGGVDVVEAKSFGFVRAAWNQDQDRFKDPRVRQAFLYAVDRAGIVSSALAGKGTVRNSVLDPIWSGDDLETYDFDQEKAKQLLTDAGWDSSDPVEISWIAGSNPDRDAAATVLQDQLTAVGVEVKLNQVQSTYFEGAYKDRSYDMVIYGGGDYASEPSSVNPITGCDDWTPNGANNGYYCNEELDQVLAQANAEVDPSARAELYQQAAAIENADPSQMWLYSPDTVYGVSERVEGFVPGSVQTFYEPWKWTVSG